MASRGELRELKKLVAAVWGSGRPLRTVNSCQWSADKEPYIYIPVGPKRISLEFSIDIGARVSVLNRQVTELGFKPSRKFTNIVGVMGAIEKCPLVRTHFSCNSLVWPVRKLDEHWWLTIDYWRLNSNILPLTAAVPNISPVVAAIQVAAYLWMAALDVKDMFPMIPLRDEDKPQFAFTWEGIQYAFNRLPQGYKHFPTIAHNTLAKLLDMVEMLLGVHIYQYIGNINEQVGQEIKFLGAWWVAGAIVVSDDILSVIEKGQIPGNKVELQQLLGYWRKHIPGSSVIACPLYGLLRKDRAWDWTLQHTEALNVLKDELKTYQKLGPLHPQDPLRVKWGFAEHASYCGVFQKGPQGPVRPLLFSFTSFKEAERRYIEWVKGHVRDGTPAAKWNQQVDHLAQIRVVNSDKGDWDRLVEWLHIKRGHSGKIDLCCGCWSWGWPVPMKMCEAILMACPQCQVRLKINHPNQTPAQHIKEGKALWSTWQVDYVGPLKPSHGRRFILVGVGVVSGLTMATAVNVATGGQTVQVLKGWFSILPISECIQSDNGSHFTAAVVQDWARGEGIEWVFYTPYYPQANGMVERYVCQPVMVKLLLVGIVSMVLVKSRGLYAWEALDKGEETHRISVQWIISDF